MYIQITERCNMSCKHCCFSSTAEGEDMSLETFKQASAMSQILNTDPIVIGGGEPTLHPDFWEMLDVATESRTKDGSVHIITNGSHAATAMKLAKLNAEGLVCTLLSVDEYHEPIDKRVVKAFSTQVYDATNALSKTGRAAEHLPDASFVSSCPSPEIFVTPSGDVYACGCKSARLGTVYAFVPIPISPGYRPYTCWEGQDESLQRHLPIT